jgi:MarR family 2-MHQ and catechol resistance regulon transcriptional repressor
VIHIPLHIIAQMLSHAAVLKLALAKQFGLSPFESLALALVGSADLLSIKELKQRLSLPGSSLTFTIDSLEKKKLIKRLRSKEDRRQWFLYLTAKGKRLYGEILSAEGSLVWPTIDKLSETERVIFLKLAKEIIQTPSPTHEEE